MFITFEGIDGCGKTTQSKLLAKYLESLGHRVTLTREPGGTPEAEEIRDLLVKGDKDRWTAKTEALLFNAARCDHVEKIISPAIMDWQIVICDRFVDSTRVYQGTRRGNEPIEHAQYRRGFIDGLHDLSIKINPHRTFIIDMDAKLADERTKARQNQEGRFESFGLDFQKDLRKGFLKLAKQFPNRCRVINGEQSPDQVAADIIALMPSLLQTFEESKNE